MSAEIISHINSVRVSIERIIQKLRQRGESHDKSKLQEPELSTFKIFSQRLSDVEYGSREYWSILKENDFQLSLQHHYANNRHHPEYHANGINDMSMIDIIEMLADWHSAANKQGNSLLESLKIQKERFNINDQLYNIMVNTVVEMEWEK